MKLAQKENKAAMEEIIKKSENEAAMIKRKAQVRVSDAIKIVIETIAG